MTLKKHSELDWPKFIRLGRSLLGKPYNFGEEVDLRDPDPAHIKAIDCSELIEWLYAQIGMIVPDGSYNQFKASQPITGSPLVGDLAFKWVPETRVIHHVGTWIDGLVLEAKGKAWGVVATRLDDYQASSHFAGWRRLAQIQDA